MKKCLMSLLSKYGEYKIDRNSFFNAWMRSERVVGEVFMGVVHI